MAKLPKKHRFLDLSDYGRFVARWIAGSLKNTAVSPLHLTTAFIISGLIAILCMLNGYLKMAALFLLVKSVLDAADGELARIKKTPSYVGRYYDSIADIALNFLFLLTFWHITNGSLFYVLLAFIGIQLQGTLYNYYYVILRNKLNGDTTSRVFEIEAPRAFNGEKQKTVNLFFSIYEFCYSKFDKSIYHFDKKAVKSKAFPNWFMTMLSTLGLGFQLLIMSVMLLSGLEEYVIPFFIAYSLLIFVFVSIRRFILI